MNQAFQNEFRNIDAAKIYKAAESAVQGFKQDGRGAVVVELDTVSKQCAVTWQPMARITNVSIRLLASKYDPQSQFVVVGKPLGQSDAQSYMSQILPIR